MPRPAEPDEDAYAADEDPEESFTQALADWRESCVDALDDAMQSSPV